MPWLKCTPVFKHGYGQPEYRELRGDESPDYLEEIKDDMAREYGDPEGLREPRWEILDKLPEAVLREKIERADSLAKAARATCDRLHLQLLKDYP